MKTRQITFLLLVGWMSIGTSSLLGSDGSIQPVTPNAPPEAVELLKFFYGISGQHTLTGQHNFPADKDKHTQAAIQAWGKVPAVFGKDWGFAREGDKDSAYVRGDIVEELKDQYKKGSLVTMCWHQVPPTADEPVTFRGRRGGDGAVDLNSVQGQLADAQYKDLLTPGTVLHKRWCSQVDALVPYFKKLEEAHVPLLWRPVHEMNGTWFWWGGRRGEYGTAAIYKMMFERLVNHHQIKNLIWVWSVDRPEGTSLKFEEYWPGSQYVDVLSLDCYREFKQSYYDDLLKLAAGKPIALAEVGAPPSLEVLAQQPKWTWWMTWAGMGQGRRPGVAEAMRALVHDPRSWSLSDPEYRKAIAPIRLASGLPAEPPISAIPQPPVTRQMTLTTMNKAGDYGVGEKVRWEVEVRDPNAVSVTQTRYSLKRNGLTTYQEGTLDLSSGKTSIETSLDAPGAVFLEIRTGGQAGRTLAGALVAPEKLEPSVARPDDFDAFWDTKIRQLNEVPANPQVEPNDSGRPNVEYFIVRMDHINGTHVYGQLARPRKEGRFPALLIPQWAGIYPLQKAWVVDRASKGWLALNIEPHDLPGDRPAQFYTDAQKILGSYFTQGNTDREKSYFLRMYLSCYRAAEYLCQRPDWDGKTLVVMGTSMGGQQAIVTAALHPKVTAMMACVPSGCDVAGPRHGRAAGFPDWEKEATRQQNDAILEVGRYFDPVHFAPRVTCPALVAMGLIDETCPPTGIYSACNQIKGPKEVVVMVESAHQDQKGTQAPYNRRAEEWLAAMVRTREEIK
jgi:cephalosporin-C deacetylase-like acetyl esterase